MATQIKRNPRISTSKVEAAKDPSMSDHEQKTSTAREEREQLAALGLKRCPSHVRLLDRLPDEAKVPIDGHPVEIRRASDFSRSTSYCKPCDHLLMRDARERAKAQGGSTTASRGKLEQKLTRMREQYTALWAKIQELEQQLADTQEKEEGK